jgi:DNA invertase Pin-like site-specific DNA recombinase
MPALRAAVYIRMSKDTQEDSPERQRGQIYPHCERNSYQIVGEYLDPGITGDEFVKRAEFQRLLRDAQAGKFDGIVVDHKDRVSRQHPIDYISDVVRPLYRAGVWVEAVATGRLDWDSMAGLLTDHIQQHQAAEESPKTAYRTLTELLLKAGRGEGTGGPVPYGYVMTYREEMRKGRMKRIPVRYALGDPLKVEVVQWLFRQYATGRWSIDQLRNELHARAVRGPRDTEWWSKPTITRILANRRYVGDWVYNQKHCGKWAVAEGGTVKTTAGGRRSAPRRNPESDWVVVPDWHPAIIDRETFAVVQARLQENRENKTPLTYVLPDGTRAPKGAPDARPAPCEFVLNQLLVCGACQMPMWGFNERGERKYRCSGNQRYGQEFCACNTVWESVVLASVVEALQEKLLNPEAIELLRADLRRKADEARRTDEAGRLRNRVAELGRHIDQGNERIITLPADRIPGVVAKLREMEAERGRLAVELERLATGADLNDFEALVAGAEQCLWDLRRAVNEARPDELRASVREFVSRVVLDFEPRRKPRNRSPLTGGMIYLKSDVGGSTDAVISLRVRSHMHHGLAALRKYLEPRLR